MSIKLHPLLTQHNSKTNNGSVACVCARLREAPKGDVVEGSRGSPAHYKTSAPFVSTSHSISPIVEVARLCRLNEPKATPEDSKNGDPKIVKRLSHSCSLYYEPSSNRLRRSQPQLCRLYVSISIPLL